MKLPSSDIYIYKCFVFFLVLLRKIKVEQKVGKGREKLKNKHSCLAH